MASLPQFDSGNASTPPALARFVRQLGAEVMHQPAAVTVLARHVLHGRQPQPDRAPRVVLLMGPPGTGKTVAAGYVADMLARKDGDIPHKYRIDCDLPRDYYVDIAANQRAANSTKQVSESIATFYDKLRDQVAELPIDHTSLAELMRKQLSGGLSTPPERRKAVILLDEVDKLPTLWKPLMQFFTHGKVEAFGRVCAVPEGWELTILLATNVGEHLIQAMPLGDVISDHDLACLKDHFTKQVLKGLEAHASRVLNSVAVFRDFTVEQHRQVTRGVLQRMMDSYQHQLKVRLLYDGGFESSVLSKVAGIKAVRSIRTSIKEHVQSALVTLSFQHAENKCVALSYVNNAFCIALFDVACLGCELPATSRIEFDWLLVESIKKVCIAGVASQGFRVSCPHDILHLLRQARGLASLSAILAPVRSAVSKRRSRAKFTSVQVHHFELSVDDSINDEYGTELKTVYLGSREEGTVTQLRFSSGITVHQMTAAQRKEDVRLAQHAIFRQSASFKEFVLPYLLDECRAAQQVRKSRGLPDWLLEEQQKQHDAQVAQEVNDEEYANGSDAACEQYLEHETYMQEQEEEEEVVMEDEAPLSEASPAFAVHIQSASAAAAPIATAGAAAAATSTASVSVFPTSFNNMQRAATLLAIGTHGPVAAAAAAAAAAPSVSLGDYVPLKAEVLATLFPNQHIDAKLVKRLGDHLRNRRKQGTLPAGNPLPKGQQSSVYRLYKDWKVLLEESHPTCYTRACIDDFFA